VRVLTERCRLSTDLQHSTGAPGIGVLGALRRFWFVALIPVLLLVGAAVWLGLSRPERYKATAVMSVGHVYGTTPTGIPGVLEATQTLASVYSRTIHAGDVQHDAAQRLAQQSIRARGTLDATPIPDSPLIRVTAESESPRAAVALANAGSAALSAYVDRQSRPTSTSALMNQYQDADLTYQRLLAASQRAQRRYGAARNHKTKRALNEATAAVNAARLRLDALGTTYKNAAQGETANPSVEVFARAAAAVGDRSSVMQMLVFVGAIGGIAAGAALALLLAHRRPRRRIPT
jgi:uncharacterized protein involved in exopolysaccharide biosynthesis